MADEQNAGPTGGEPNGGAGSERRNQKERWQRRMQRALDDQKAELTKAHADEVANLQKQIATLTGERDTERMGRRLDNARAVLSSKIADAKIVIPATEALDHWMARIGHDDSGALVVTKARDKSPLPKPIPLDEAFSEWAADPAIARATVTTGGSGSRAPTATVTTEKPDYRDKGTRVAAIGEAIANRLI